MGFNEKINVKINRNNNKNIPPVQNYPNLVVFKVLLKKRERGLRIYLVESSGEGAYLSACAHFNF